MFEMKSWYGLCPAVWLWVIDPELLPILPRLSRASLLQPIRTTSRLKTLVPGAPLVWILNQLCARSQKNCRAQSLLGADSTQLLMGWARYRPRLPSIVPILRYPAGRRGLSVHSAKWGRVLRHLNLKSRDLSVNNRMLTVPHTISNGIMCDPLVPSPVR